MYLFQSDYMEGCHKRILDALTDTNFQQHAGYGEDDYCKLAAEQIKTICHQPQADVHFLVGGTQANKTVIASILKPYQGVLSASSGHISVHETGAIESTGHKVLTLPAHEGRLLAADVFNYCQAHFSSPCREHEVQPGMVYISQSTETGSIYSKADLMSLSAVCKEYHLPLFVDGARLGYALMSPDCDMSISDLASYADVFTIGGTKCGALFGEAVVIVNPNCQTDFRYHVKQQGGMLAKGRLLGVQFDALFKNNLYFDICKTAVEQALRLRNAFEGQGVSMYGEGLTNQQFPILSTKQLDYLSQYVQHDYNNQLSDDEHLVRYCTSWATTQESIDQFCTLIENLNKL